MKPMRYHITSVIIRLDHPLYQIFSYGGWPLGGSSKQELTRRQRVQGQKAKTIGFEAKAKAGDDENTRPRQK